MNEEIEITTGHRGRTLKDCVGELKRELAEKRARIVRLEHLCDERLVQIAALDRQTNVNRSLLAEARDHIQTLVRQRNGATTLLVIVIVGITILLWMV